MGKTVLSSILAHRLPNNLQQTPPLVLSIYLNYKSTNTQTLPLLIESLLKQLIQNNKLFKISDDLKNIYRKAKRLQLNPVSYFNNIRKILATELSDYNRFYIIVDDFDEIPLRDQIVLRQKLLKLQPKRGRLVIIGRQISQKKLHSTYVYNRYHKKDLAIALRYNVYNKSKYDLYYDCRNKELLYLNNLYRLTKPKEGIEIVVKISYTNIERFIRRKIDLKIRDNKRVIRDNRDDRITEIADTTPF